MEFQGGAKVGVTDEEGRFELEFARFEGPSLATLEFTRPGDAPVRRRIFLHEATQYDFGDLVLGPPGSLIVRVVDKAGRVQEKAQVYLELGRRPHFNTSQQNGVKPDPRTGEVRFDDLAAGSYTLAAAIDLGSESLGTQEGLEVAAGVETVHLLAFDEVLSPVSEIALSAGGFDVDLQPGHWRVLDEVAAASTSP